jgi:hypothetical protein
MNLIAPTVESTAVPEPSTEPSNITSEATALAMKVKPIAINFHGCNASGVHLWSALSGGADSFSDDIVGGGGTRSIGGERRGGFSD